MTRLNPSRKAPPNRPPAGGLNALPTGPLGLMPAWLVTVLRPAALTLMAACVALPLTQILGALVPGLHGELFFGAIVLAALEANFTQYLIRIRYVSGADIWRLRAIEFGFYFVAIKLGQVLVVGAPAAGWPRDPQALLLYLFDLETILIMLATVSFALAVSDTLDDLDRVGEPAEIDKQYVTPLDSLTGRFFGGGVLVLVLSGLARVGLLEAFNLEHAPVTGLVANVLLYFVVGFLMLGQVRLALLATNWQTQGARVPPEMGGRWVRYSLVFLGLAGLIAFALPTGYTAGALGLVGSLVLLILGVISALAVALLGVFLLPISWLMSLLHTEQMPVAPDNPVVPPPSPLETLNQALPAWVDALRSVVVWGLLIGMALYVVINYLRDRPELLRAVRELAALRRLRQLWAALRHRLSGLAAAVQAGPVAAWLRERLRARPNFPALRYFRLGGASPREQVQYYYLSLLQRASEVGFGRRPAQTPAEYDPVLRANLPESSPEVQALTEAFIETRYSAHPVEPEQVARVRAAWSGLRAALTKLKRQQRKEHDHHG